ncbi:MAG: ABC transporter ATP-binding protein [Saprospiraceae bacterium]|nr:ABC transporter ATP-binding protein [Saprospiraceae bacterium]MDW8483713.1 ABC transporter ATP-binding protein [Saprospiraceae bacterium]
MSVSPLLSVRALSVAYGQPARSVEVLRGISFDLLPGESLGIVGESGSGKSTLALALMALLPKGAHSKGEIIFDGRPISAWVRGREIGIVFQEPATALHPLFRCGFQIAEVIRRHRGGTARQIRQQVMALLERVCLEEPARIYRAYPHELSGGQQQRVLLAMALAGCPRLLIADEPTTALDTVTQQGVLQLLSDLRQKEGLTTILISHDLRVVARTADRVLVLRGGEMVEMETVPALLNKPKHPYTRGLVTCQPELRCRLQRLPSLSEVVRLGEAYSPPPPVSSSDRAYRHAQLYVQAPLVRLEAVSVYYPERRRCWLGACQGVKALSDLSLDVFPGEILGVAGESGSGKSTLGRVIAALQAPSKGNVYYRNLPLNVMSMEVRRQMRREVQIVFQDPYRSLNPRLTVGYALQEPMVVHRLCATEREYRRAVVELLERIGLSADFIHRYPHELSGGQRQRICLARALAVRPQLLVCDEITSALDASVQAEILNLLLDLQRDLNLTYVFISHDLRVLHHMCDRILVLYRGQFEALDTSERLIHEPPTPYVRRLVEAVLP